jgi:putative ABC transport system permease protein
MAGGTIFRLRPGLSFEEAKRQMAALAAKTQIRSAKGGVFSAGIYPVDYRAVLISTRAALTVLLASVGLVLLIACANVANLLFARALVRRREFAVRSALGASRARLVGQLVSEAFVLTAAGGLIGLGIAAWMVRVVPRLVPLALWRDLSANPMTVDWRVLAWCAASVALTTVICGVIPAIRASRSDVVAALDGSARLAGEAPNGKRLRRGLQALEIALTLVLLAGTSLLASSLGRMMWSDPGYAIDQLVTSGYIDAPRPRYQSAASIRSLSEDIIAKIRQLPSVRMAAIGEPPPLGSGATFIPDNSDTPVAGAPAVSIYFIGSEYFRTVGTPLLRGRDFTVDDRDGAPPVAIIDADTARRFWPNGDALGKVFRYARKSSPSAPLCTIVGIAGHVKTKSFASPTGTAQVYVPVAQNSFSALRGMTMRVEGDPEVALSAVRRIVHDIDPALSLGRSHVVSDMYGDLYTTPRFYLIVVSLFAGLALVTAAIGLFAMLSYVVSRRAREIGVRLALGADSARIRLLVTREALAPVGVGLAVGLAGSFWLTRYLQSLLYGVTAYDAGAYAAAVALLMAVAGFAALLPVQRATRVDPVVTLRAD